MDKSFKLVMLGVLTCILAFLCYKNEVWNVFNNSQNVTFTPNTSKIQTVKPELPEKFDTIAEYTTDFFLQEDKAMDGECNATRIGNWEHGESTRSLQALANKKFDIIVLPVQEREPRNDRVGRLLSSRLIANEIEKRTELAVISPELVQRILGKNQIIFHPEEIKRLAAKTSAKVLYLLKRKKRDNYSRSTEETELSAVLTDSEGKIIQKELFSLGKEDTYERRNRTYREGVRDLPFAVEVQDTLEVQIEKILEQIATKFFPPSYDKKEAKEVESIEEWRLPKSLSDLPTIAKSPVDKAVYFQFLALLTPKIQEYERNRLFERSLIALQQVDKEEKYYNLLKARALFHLYRRPFALPYLSQVVLPEEKALKEYLNGNLSNLKNLLSEIDNPLLHSIATIEFYDLGYSYNQGREKNVTYKVPSENWLALVESATRDGDIWYAPDNLTFFMNIEGLFPDFDQLFKDSIHGNAVVNSALSSNRDTQIISNIFSLPSGSDPFEYSYPYGDKISDGDIWNLYRNISISNMLRSIRLSVRVHGSYGTALNKIRELENILNGNPIFQYFHAAALVGQSEKLPDSERKNALDKAFKINDEVFYNTCGVTPYTLAAEYLIEGYLKPVLPKERRYSHTPRFYGFSMDMRYYPSSLLQPSWQCRLMSLPYSNSRIDSLKILAEKNEIDFVTNELEYRFDGHPEKTNLQANMYFEKGKDDIGMKVLADAIANGDNNWNTYYLLAKKKIENEQYVEAQEILLSYPAFTNTPSDERVVTSNRALSAGNLFFDLGLYEEPVPFYKISASLSTGAGSQFRAIINLAILEQNFEQVLQFSQKAAQRYNNTTAYSILLTYLHVLGDHDSSRAGFNILINRKDSEKLWSSQIVGHRILKESIPEIVDIYSENPSFANKKQSFNHHLALLTTIDRMPTNQQIELLDKIESGVAIKLKNDTFQSAFNIILAQTVVPLFMTHMEEETENDGSYKSFANIDAKIKVGKYDEALKLILHFIKGKESLGTPVILGKGDLPSPPEPSTVSDNSDPMPLFLLPYLTMAITQSISNEQTIVDYVDQINKLSKNPMNKTKLFDFYLCDAILKANNDQIENSIRLLKKAYADKSSYLREVYRPFTREYEVIKICEWLYLEYKDQRFINLALDWSKRIQKVSPYNAWAYSFEALYGESRKDKVRATAFTQYLDPKSYWLSKVGEELKSDASSWWKLHNPFTISEEKVNQNKDI